eukprot:807668-Prymnesium_polylepis.1
MEEDFSLPEQAWGTGRPAEAGGGGKATGGWGEAAEGEGADGGAEALPDVSKSWPSLGGSKGAESGAGTASE